MKKYGMSVATKDQIKHYSFGEWLLGYIEREIEEKYKVSDFSFLYNFERFTSRKSLTEWFDKQCKQNRWVKYRFCGNNAFEIKDFSPDPSDEICYKLIYEFLQSLKKQTKEKYKTESFFLKLGVSIYNEEESCRELLFELREGRSRIQEESDLVQDPGMNSKRIIYETVFYEEELDVDVVSGYVVFENK